MRRALQALVATLLFFVLVEIGCAIAERTWITRTRTLPLPQPGLEDHAFEAKMSEARRSLSIPLAADERGSWTLPPAQVLQERGVTMRINTLGLRGAEPTAKEPGEIRLLSLGDSSIFGYGVPERDVFTTVAAAKLAEAWGRAVTGWIGGVPAHSSEQSLGVLRTNGARYQPDWVVIGNLWSDLFFQGKGARLAERAAGPLRAFATYRVLRTALSPWLAAGRVRFIDRREDIGEHGNNRVPLPQYLDNLRALAAEATRLGARPAFLVLPAPLDLDEVALPEPVVEYRAAMALVAGELGAPLVDGPAVFHARGATLGYFLDQVHPSEPGHHLLGEALAEALAPLGP